MAITVLMYHALHERGEHVEGSDGHYAVSSAQFDEQLQLMKALGMPAVSVRDLIQGAHAGPCVALTFDDGHETNLMAAHRLAETGSSADFFVNPSAVGHGRFLGWAALREMNDLGMSIQSHSQHHRYLDELSPQQVRDELKQSKQDIEDHLGSEVTVFAPPGGRTIDRLADIARDVGYRAVCTSRAGLWRRSSEPWDIPRMAMLSQTSMATFERWLRQDRGELLRMAVRHGALATLKRILGNARYERWRAAALGAKVA